MTMSHAIFWTVVGIGAFVFGVFRVAMAAGHHTSSPVGAWFLIAGLAAIAYGVFAALRSGLAARREQRAQREQTAGDR